MPATETNFNLSLDRDGVAIDDAFLSSTQCHGLLADLRNYVRAHDVPFVERNERPRSLRYRVVNGDAIYASLPQIVALYDNVLEIVRQDNPRLEPLGNRTARLNVNITPPGGEYRWHYDRNSVTAILFLNAVQGGEIEMYPRFRIHLGPWKDTSPQRMLDLVLRRFKRFAHSLVVPPQPGRMILMNADRCLHSVRRVAGTEERFNIIMAFDVPGRSFRAEKDLNSYLYSTNAASHRDPNYRRTP